MELEFDLRYYVPFPVCFGDFAGCESVIIHSFVGNFGICILFSGAIIIESKNSWTRQQQRVASEEGSTTATKAPKRTAEAFNQMVARGDLVDRCLCHGETEEGPGQPPDKNKSNRNLCVFLLWVIIAREMFLYRELDK